MPVGRHTCADWALPSMAAAACVSSCDRLSASAVGCGCGKSSILARLWGGSSRDNKSASTSAVPLPEIAEVCMGTLEPFRDSASIAASCRAMSASSSSVRPESISKSKSPCAILSACCNIFVMSSVFSKPERSRLDPSLLPAIVECGVAKRSECAVCKSVVCCLF